MRNANINKGICDGPKIGQLVEDNAFELVLEWNEKGFWEALKRFMHKFLRNESDDTLTH